MPCRLIAGTMAAGLFLAPSLAVPAQRDASLPRPLSRTSLIQLPEPDRRQVLLRFARGVMGLDADQYAELAPILERLRAEPRAIVTITSHAERMAFGIARARAAAVRRAIMGQGIAARRIRVVNAGMVAGVDPDVVQIRVR